MPSPLPYESQARGKFRGSRGSGSSEQPSSGIKESINEAIKTKAASKGKLTKDEKDKIKADFQSILQGAQKPSQESVKNLTDSVTSAIDDGKLGPA